MSVTLIRCPKCRAKLNLSRVEPGKEVHCPKCSCAITVPGAEPEPEPEPEPVEESLEEVESAPKPQRTRTPAPARRTTAASRTVAGRGTVATRRPAARAATPKGPNPKILVAVGAAVVVIGVGAFFALRPSGSKPADSASTEAPANTANTDSAKAPATSDGKAPPQAAKAPDAAAVAAKRLDYLRRADGADSLEEHLALADWCEREGFTAERKRELERALVYNSKSKDANQKIGNVLYKASEDLLNSPVYDRDLDRFNGRWLTPEEQTTVAKLEQALKQRGKDLEDAIAKDPWRKEANTIVRNVKSDSALRNCKLWETIKKPYVVFVEDEDPAIAKQIGEELAQHLCDLQVHFMEKFNGMLHNVDQTFAFRFILFANRKGFDDYNEKHSVVRGGKQKPPGKEVLAFYHNQMRTVISYRLSPSDRGITGITYSTIFHEGTHQLRAHYTAGGAENYETWTFWWNEGIAEYVAAEWDPEAAKARQHKFEAVHPHRVLEFKAALMSGKYVPLFDLVSRTDQGSVQSYLYDKFKFQPNEAEELMGQFVSLFYAESWSFIYFLNNYKVTEKVKVKEKDADGNEKEVEREETRNPYRDLFTKYCMAEFQGEYPHDEEGVSGSRPYLQNLLGFQNRADWEKLESKWIEFVKSL